jgi:hypothetical protein
MDSLLPGAEMASLAAMLFALFMEFFLTLAAQ